MLSNRNPKRRMLKCFLGVAVVILAIGIFSFQYPRLITQIVFGANTSPVELVLRGSYGAREGDEKTAAIASAATAFLASLNDAQKKAATYAFSDNAQRSNWSNFPEGMFPRGGLKLGELTEAQRANLEALLAEFMSEKGARNIDYQLAAADYAEIKPFHEIRVRILFRCVSGRAFRESAMDVPARGPSPRRQHHGLRR